MSKLSKGLKKVEKKISNIVPHQHSEDRRLANQEVSEQIDLYKKQKELMDSEAKRVEFERKQQQDKVSRKQISSARHAYRQPGFMDEQSSGYDNTLA